MNLALSALEQLPFSYKFCANGTAIGTLVIAFLEKIHGPVVTLGAIASAMWVCLQIYLAVEKRWFKRK